VRLPPPQRANQGSFQSVARTRGLLITANPRNDPTLVMRTARIEIRFRAAMRVLMRDHVGIERDPLMGSGID
jgi:hypothetical protein